MITVSFFTSIILLQKTKAIKEAMTRGNQRTGKNTTLHRASVTIIIFTTAYILCNVSNIMSNVLYALSYSTYPEPYFNRDIFMKYYIWNIFEIFTVCLNSAVNPVIYFTRNSRFRMKLSTVLN